MDVTHATAPLADAAPATLFVALELSRSTWLVAMHSPIGDKVSQHRLEGGDTEGLLELLTRKRAQAAEKLGRPVRVACCFEAGYGGFWLHYRVAGGSWTASTQAQRWPQVGFGRASAGGRKCPTTAATTSGACSASRAVRTNHRRRPWMVTDGPTTPTAARQASNRRSVAEGARPKSAPSPIRKASPARPLVSRRTIPARALWIGTSRGPWLAAHSPTRKEPRPQCATRKRRNSANRMPERARMEMAARRSASAAASRAARCPSVSGWSSLPRGPDEEPRGLFPLLARSGGGWVMAGCPLAGADMVGTGPHGHHLAAAAGA